MKKDRWDEAIEDIEGHAKAARMVLKHFEETLRVLRKLKAAKRPFPEELFK